MTSSTGHHKVQSNAMKAYRKQRQYIYRHCQLCHVTTSYAVMVGVCILMLPMLELATEHVQLTSTCNINHVPPPCMNFSHTPLELPSLKNMLPAMVLQNHLAWLNITYPSYTSSCSNGHRVSLSLASTGLGRRVVGVVVRLLLLMSGDIEMNPGPLGKCTCLVWLEVMWHAWTWWRFMWQVVISCTGSMSNQHKKFLTPTDLNENWFLHSFSWDINPQWVSVASYPGSSTEKRGGSLEGCIPQLLSKLESYWSTLYTQSIHSYVN